ncbi:MAG: GNAT family N-acetyltransferase [Phycisphaeraceae bacterium]|nr:GNAT family N-acetyltransferase [Phycisphaerales bacterium]MCB9859003.1 GNAT family N-acetyltransferase [Phycisphaeraceae bacterium]
MSEVVFRPATRDDLPAIVAMLTDDPIGKTRESADIAPYESAFAAITASPDSEVYVAELDDRVVGTLQLTIIPNLSRSGATRAQIEGVRVHTSVRGMGIGKQLVEHAIRIAKERGCALMQLTTDKARPDAVRFYESLGFEATHEGMKQILSGDPPILFC